LVGAKGLVESAKAARELGFKLKIVGEAVGHSRVKNELEKIEGVELLGRVTDTELYGLYAEAKGFIALAKEEDFGITVVEAQAAGTPVIAFNGGGFRETVIDGVTGILIDGTDEKTMEKAMGRFETIKWNREKLISNARKFSKEEFVRKIKNLVGKIE
jgi:glycosyltransferase involved in cell wall biosynthesis